MKKSTYYVLSSCFLLSGGFLYTFERFIAYYVWIGRMSASSHTGSYPASPLLPGLTSNWFVAIFVTISLILWMLGLIKKD